MSIKYRPAQAMLEHMLDGNKISLLEAMLLFGVQSPNAELTRMKKNGLLIKSERVPMAKVVHRINQYTLCKVPESLPYKEVWLTEYWISK